ncbi:MAG: hydrogenase formation protein HypD [Thermoprotei archaeon]|nr:MAG: hydrogenase formation protein HypD [Thermoprotei archaeon]
MTDEYRQLLNLLRSSEAAGTVVRDIERLSRGIDNVKIVHVCGTHEHTISRFGIRLILPKNVKLIAGPGCPVCITPASEIDAVIELALSGVAVLTFGDMLRVPGSELSLFQARSRGADVRVVYSFLDAIKVARSEPSREFVFFAIGFETTAATVAPYIALGKVPENLSLFVSHRLIPPAMEFMSLLRHGADAYIAPGHVSTIIGCKPYEVFPKVYRQSVVIAGFEPLDVLLAVKTILDLTKRGDVKLVNEYSRAVRYEGNVLALKYMYRVFEVVDGAWRGIGVIPQSKLCLRSEYRRYDAVERYGISIRRGIDVRPGCRCGDVIVGRAVPTDCPYFAKVCTPNNPLGPCMVSMEGTCRIWYQFERTRGGEVSERERATEYLYNSSS